MSRRALAPLVVLLGCLLAPAAAHAVEPGMVIGPRETNNIDQIDRADRAGSDWVRVFVNWATAEPSPGQLDEFYLREFDERVDRARAAGLKVVMVVTNSPGWASGSSSASAPPQDPETYASFIRRYAERYRGRVAAWEIWNEPDEGASWSPAPDPGRYAELLRASYGAVKVSDPGAVVVLGGLVGNHYRFLEQVYAAGGKGSFDAVGLHTDTACLTAPPEEQYREPDGRIGRFSFTGYREVRRSMLANGDDKPIWMTEIGWSTLTTTCQVGGRAGTKPSGVTESQQASYLTRAYRCMQNDPYVAVALWFSVQDVSTSTTRYDHRLGLIRDNGTLKPAYENFSDWANDPSPPASNCGFGVDQDAPKVTILAPRSGQGYLDRLLVVAKATDDDRVVRMELYANGEKVPGSQRRDTFRLDWNGAKNLPDGRNTLTIRARDAANNVGEASVEVVRGNENTLEVAPPKLTISARRAGGRRVRLRGRVTAPGSPIRPKGRVRFFLETKRGKRWKPFSRYTKGVARPYNFTVPIKKPGIWRVRVKFVGQKPFGNTRTRVKRLGRFR